MNGPDLVHGGALDRVKALYPLAPQPWLDLSTGINPHPYPAPPLLPHSFAHLPTTSENEACRQAMAQYYGAPVASLMLVPGTEILIRLLPSLLEVQTVALARPTYGDHLSCWQTAGANVVEMADPAELAGKVDAIVLCNPNNPDGRIWPPEILEDCRARQAARQGWLIVDEAYADIAPSLSLAARGGAAGLIVLRSFGKFFGLAGLRLGGLIAPEALLREAQKRFGVWSVSGPALHVGTQAVADTDWIAEARHRLETSRLALDEALSGAGVPILGGTSLFRYVQVPDAHALWQALAEQGIYTRRFSWSRHHLRLGLSADDVGRQRLSAALAVSL